jgi:hypothetical protein
MKLAVISNISFNLKMSHKTCSTATSADDKNPTANMKLKKKRWGRGVEEGNG